MSKHALPLTLTKVKPLVSIIVPTFNRARFIEKSVRTILNQTYKEIDCLVVDGASTDGSIEVLRKLASEDPRLRFVSEPDEGEVDAVNKGLDIARGQIVGIHSSDDFYLPDAVESSVAFLTTNPEYIGVSGDARYIDEDGRDLGRGVITYRGEMSKRTLRRILVLRHKSTFVCHGAFFGWRERMLKWGKLDPSFSVMPDLEFYSRLLSNGERIACLPKHQFNFTIHPDMGALRFVAKVEQQRKLLHKKYNMRWYHLLLQSVFGKTTNYILNPYRAPLLEGLKWEVRMLMARVAESRQQK